MRRSFTADFKQGVVKRILLPGGPSISEVSKELEIGYNSINSWIKKYGIQGVMSNSENMSPEKKLQAVIEISSLSEKELGTYLRKNGLNIEEIETWKSDFYQSQRGPGRPKKDPELKAAQKNQKNLERDIRRKDKALAEMTARIVLLKKSHLLWGVDEDDEPKK